MTSPSSSTSSSRQGFRRYLATLAATTVVVSGLLFALSYLGVSYGFGGSVNVRVFLDQQARLQASGPLDTVMLGDSSLGAAIDEAAWEQATGREALNLALNGSYGIEGTYNMLRQVLMQGRPRTVLIMQTVDALGRNPSTLGELYSSIGLDTGLFAGVVNAVRVYFNQTMVTTAALGLWDRIAGIEPEEEATPPLMTPEAIAASVDLKDYRDAAVTPQKVEWLQRIAGLCREQGLQCLYMHGPVYEGICTKRQAYIDDVTRGVEAAGLPLVPGTPICMPEGAVADAIDHVRPELRPDYTQQLARMVAALDRDAATPVTTARSQAAIQPR